MSTRTLVLTSLKSGSVTGSCTMAALCRCWMCWCDTLSLIALFCLLHNLEWRLESALATNTNTQPLTSVVANNYEVSWIFFSIYSRHNYGEWLDVHIHSLPRRQDVVTIVVQYFEGMVLLVTDKLRIFLPNHTGTHTRARTFMRIKHNGKHAAQTRANARKYTQQNRV